MSTAPDLENMPSSDPEPEPEPDPGTGLRLRVVGAVVAFGLSLAVGFGIGAWRSSGSERAASPVAPHTAPTTGEAIPVVEPVGNPLPPVPGATDATTPSSAPTDLGVTDPASPPAAGTFTPVSVPADPARVAVDGSDPTFSGASSDARAAFDAAGIPASAASADERAVAPPPDAGATTSTSTSSTTPGSTPAPAPYPDLYLVGGPSAEPSAMRFEDVCAKGAPASCPDGTSGTILAEGWAVPDPPMAFTNETYTADRPLTAECAGDRRSFPGQAVLELVTNNPGTFVVTGDVQATVTTPDAETQRWRDEPGRRAPITTCMAVSHPPDIIDIAVTATDVNGSVATHRDSLQLESATARPPIAVTPVGAASLRIALPVTHQEQTAVVVQPADDHAGANPCRSTTAVPTPAIVQRVPLDTTSLADTYDPSFDELSVTTIVAPAATVDVCVLAVETESVGVSYVSYARSYRVAPPSTYGISAEITDVKPTREAPPVGPLTVELTRQPGVAACTVTDDAQALAGHGTGPHAGTSSWGGRPLCELRSSETDGLVKLRATFGGRPSEVSVPVPARACVSLANGSPFCPVVPLDQLVAVPISGDASVYVHLHLDPPVGSRGAWMIGEAHDRLDQLGTEPSPPVRPDAPRLDRVNTRVTTPDGRTGESQLDVRWNADRPVHVIAWVDDFDHATCSRTPDAHDFQTAVGRNWGATDPLSDQGTVSLGGLCAGTRYRIALTLVDGPGHVSAYQSPRPGTRPAGDAVEGTTRPTEVRYAAQVTLPDVPASWRGRYLRVRYVTGASEGRSDWTWTWSNPPLVFHPPASAWNYDTSCEAVDGLADERPGHVSAFGTGAASGVITVPGQTAAPIGSLAHRVSQNVVKWPEDVDVAVGLQAYVSATGCGSTVSQDEVDHAPAADFVWTNRFIGHGRIVPQDAPWSGWVATDAQGIELRAPSTPDVVLRLRVVATRADHDATPGA